MRTVSLAFAAALVLLASPWAVSAQTSAKDIGQKASETGEAIRDYAVEQKDKAVAHAKRLTRDLDAKLTELERRASKQTGEAKAKSEQVIKDLKAKRAKAGAKLDALGKATKASWDDATNGFADAFHDLATSYDKAVAAFKH